MTAPAKTNWPVPDEFPLLHSREIHLWCAWLGHPGGAEPPGETCLSADETARADTFHFESDRQRFVASRSNLRQVLAAYAGRPPETLVFSYGRFGKPMLVHRADTAGPADPPLNNLCFNQSHCGSLWLLAVAWNQPVGVDLEKLRDLPDLDLLERKIFAAKEVGYQQALPAAERRRGFFHRWTQQEAVVKFQGVGFEPSVRFDPAAQGDLLVPADNYVGFLAYGGAPVRIRRFGWNPQLLRPSETAAAGAPRIQVV